MTHIVTGGAGFIGSHLVDQLVETGQRVRVIDNFKTGSMDNLQGAMKTGLVTIQQLNLENYGFPISHNDVVWHLAAKVGGIGYNRTHQYEMLRTNVAINHNVIESVRKQNPRLFFYASSACIYPHDAPVPTPESAGSICDPQKANHGYGVAKWVGEQMVKHLSKEHNQACVIARFFNAIGTRDHYYGNTHVVPALIKRTHAENPVVVWGSGQQTRVFVDARDIAKALLMLYDVAILDQDTLGEKLEQPWIVNVGHDKEVSIATLIDTIVRLCDVDVAYEFDTTRPDGDKRRAADNARLKGLIGWVPDTPLETTITDMIVDYRERYG